MRSNKFFKLSVILSVLFSFYGCGAPAAQPAQPTQAPTAVPEPSPTRTPPFNLNVKVLDSQSTPISGASVEIAGKTLISSANGTAAFSDLSGENIDLKVNATGYKTSEEKVPLKPGENMYEVKLEENPYGLLPANACAPGEKLLYVEDFQSGNARQWDAVENKTPGWTVEADPQNPQNLVLAARKGVSWAWLGGRETYKFNNVIWRIHYKFTGSGNSHFNFRFVESPNLVRRYLLPFNNNSLNLLRFQPDNQVEVGQIGKSASGEWHLLEIGDLNGEIFTFLDGKKGLTWKDPNPWKDGTVNLEPYPETDAVFYYDNISICELSASPSALPAPKTGYNLAVTLKGVDGTPVGSGGIKIVELGNQEGASMQSDQGGKAAWTDLPGISVTVQVSAAGYKPVEKKQDINKGENNLEVALERDPLRKLAAELCAPGETLLYTEDFQSGTVSGWSALSQKLKMNIPGVSIADDPDVPGNKILMFKG